MKRNRPPIFFRIMYIKKSRIYWFVLFFWAFFLPNLYCEAEGLSWKRVKNWGYQLQDIKLNELTASPFDLLVIDYSRDGSDFECFTREDIAVLKNSKRGGRLVLAYISIGEAESYRFYWKKSWKRDRPVWLDRENPDWDENFKVNYWNPGWKKIIFGYLDKILAAGFDGVYLDIIDAYEYYEERGKKSAADEMKQFVVEIAHYTRKVSGNQNFGVFPQNAEELLADTEYLSVITGIGKEDTYFGYEEDDLRSPPKATASTELFLDMARKAGKLVLNVDYTTIPEKMAESYARALSHGYVEYCAGRELDRIIPQPWFSERIP